MTKVHGGVLACDAEAHQPALLIQAAKPTSEVELVRGRMHEPQGWYFPDQNVALPATTVALRYPMSAGAVLLPVLVSVVPPDSPAIPSTDLSVRAKGDMLVATWLERDRPRQIEFPRPFA